jgi:hypothetical protein
MFALSSLPTAPPPPPPLLFKHSPLCVPLFILSPLPTVLYVHQTREEEEEEEEELNSFDKLCASLFLLTSTPPIVFAPPNAKKKKKNCLFSCLSGVELKSSLPFELWRK